MSGLLSEEKWKCDVVLKEEEWECDVLGPTILNGAPFTLRS